MQNDIDTNKRAIRALYEDVFNTAARDGAIAERIANAFAPDASEHGKAVATSIAALATGFPDIRYTIDDLVGEGDRVAIRWHWTGTHRAAFRGHPASGKAVTNAGHAMFTLRDGRITAVALETDRLGFLQAIGVVAADVGTAGPRVVDTARAPRGVYLLDTFTVPAAARAEFEATMKRNRDYIRTLDGFRGDAVLVRANGDAAFDIATIAAWDNADAIAHAKQDVAAYYQRIGWDMPAALATWGVTLVRTICAAPPELQ